jgi:hypothetical protein
MPGVFKKLNIKDRREILVVNPPASFEAVLSALSGVAIVRDPEKVKAVSFSLAFISKQAELDSLSEAIAAKAVGDALVWFAYPKKSSKNYTCEFDRDTGWHVLGRAGFEGVRQVAIDDDWSALRFRRVEYIKSLKRDPKRALSAEGRRRTAAK